MDLGFISHIRGNDRNLRKLCVSLFFGIFLIVGLSIYKDYGISWDENIERDNGIISLNYVAGSLKLTLDNTQLERHKLTTNLDEWRDRRYPVAFNLPLAILESIFRIDDEQKIYQFRHLMTFFVFFCGVYAVFLLAERRFSSWKIGLLAATFLILSPRFFAESFYNSKDLVLLAMFAITTNVIVKFLLNPSINGSIICALATAVTMNVRLMAIVFPFIVVGLLITKAIKHEIPVYKFFIFSSIYLFLTAVLVVLMWPWLWGAPWERFMEALKFMLTYRFDSTNFFQGQLIKSDQLPWFYLPIWIGITTPVIYLGLFFVGLLAILKSLCSSSYRLWTNNEQLQDIIFLGLSVVPILAVMAMGSVLYDGWRHMYFIYPAFLLIAMGGWICIWKKIKPYPILKNAGIAILATSLLTIAAWIVRAHPLQNVYFNILAGSNWYKKYDVDYWGLANKQVLIDIARSEEKALIRIWPGSDTPLQNSIPILPPEIRGRIIIVNNIEDADYIITNFRGNQKEYESPNDGIFTILDKKIGDESIIRAYKINSPKYISVINYQVEKLSVGSELNFSKNGLSSKYLLPIFQKDHKGSGWSYPEDWGVWSDGESGLLYLGYKDANVKGIRIRVQPFLAKGISQQVIGVYLNGRLQKIASLSHPNQELDISLINIATGAPVLVEFKFYTASKPVDADMGNDTRLLSMGLISGVIY